MDPNELFDPELLLAAEDFPDEEFEKYHTFAEYEDGIIRKLIAHGPILLRGGRGSGKSALLKEAYNRINKGSISQKAIGIYISLRYLPLLRYQDQEYERFFCKLLIEHVKKFIESHNFGVAFDSLPEVDELQKQLINLSIKINRLFVNTNISRITLNACSMFSDDINTFFNSSLRSFKLTSDAFPINPSNNPITIPLPYDYLP